MTPVRYRNILKTGLVGGAALILLGIVNAAQAEPRDPMKIPDAQYEPLMWPEIEGWAEDDHDAAFAAFLKSCKAILRSTPATREGRPMYAALFETCRKATEVKAAKPGAAREFFELNFRPVRISPLGSPDGFLTGYYEPIVEGTRNQSNGFDYPLYRKPPNLLVGGRMMISSAATGKKKARKRKLVPFHDRAAIDDGVLAGRSLEICWLKDPIDAFFTHIQGSVRVRLENGDLLRLNYQAANGHPYYAVGRSLIDRKIVPKEEMSMDRIRQWMEANPDEGKELRRKNKSYVFFRETDLKNDEEPIGAQGISLTAGRSIAVDRKLHVYGTPFFISAELPIDSDLPTTQFRRLMIAQDTGGAIIGPARADLYFGAGDEAGSISGRIRHPGRFVMLLPRELDPSAIKGPVPLPRPKPDMTAAAETKPDNKASGKVAEAKAEMDKAEKSAKSQKAEKSDKKMSEAKAPAKKRKHKRKQ